MGLSSSQARLLNLTARMHDIEYKAQNLEAQKLQMANESTQVYKEYEDALNKQKVQLKKIGSDGAASYTNITGSELALAGYAFEVVSGNNSGKVYNTVGAAATAANINLSHEALGDTMGTVKVVSEQKVTSTTYSYSDLTLSTPSSTDMALLQTIMPSNKWLYCSQLSGYVLDTESGPGDNYGVLAAKSATAKLVYHTIDDSIGVLSTQDGTTETISNLLQGGYIVLVKMPAGADWHDGDDINFIKSHNSTLDIYETNIATDTSLQEVSDETELKKAEAKYEADMRKIDAKDKKFDTDLAAMETERNAIKTEMDTLKGVAKDNVDRTFKLFG